MVHTGTISIRSQGFSDIIDVTRQVQSIITESGMQSGIANVFMSGSTASVSTIEYEPALVADMQEQLEKFASRTMKSRHSETWGDDNGFSHIRATFMGPGMTAPFSNGHLMLGTWQQIVVIDHDNRPRTREVVVQLVGE